MFQDLSKETCNSASIRLQIFEHQRPSKTGQLIEAKHKKPFYFLLRAEQDAELAVHGANHSIIKL